MVGSYWLLSTLQSSKWSREESGHPRAVHQQGSQWGEVPSGSVLIHFILNLATRISKEQGHGMPGLMLGVSFHAKDAQIFFYNIK